MSVLRSLLRIISLLACALVLAGCGNATRIAYGQADDLLYWWLDGYVDFNDQQSPRARDEIAALLQWHRASQLPRYADLLARLQPLARADMKAEQACAAADEARGLLNALLQQAEPAAAWLAAGLTAAQLEHMQRKFDKNNEEFEREWRRLDPDERRKKRIKQARERSEMLYGRLDAAQLAVVAATVDESRFDIEGSHTERLRRQQDMLQTLRRIASEKPAAGQAQAMVRGLAERSLASPNPVWRARADALWREACASFARVHNSTTPAQRARALETLKSYEADFRAMAAKKN